MKNKIIISLFITCFAALFVMQSCKKEKVVSQVVKVSFPVMTLLGDPIIILNHGDQFVDPGATWKDSVTGETGTVKSTTVVSTTTDGLFVISYTASNKYGLSSTITRDVAVTGITDALDLTGTYLRAATGLSTNVTKLGRGLFYSDNIGGNSTGDAGVFLIETDSSMFIPTQTLTNDGTASFAQVNISYAPPITMSYQILNPNYGTSVRTFVKQ